MSEPHTAERRSLELRVKAIRRLLALPIGRGAGLARGYASAAEHWEKRRRLQILEARLVVPARRMEEGRGRRQE